MIVDFLWSGVYAILNAVFSALPTVTLPFTSIYSQLESIGELLAPWNAYFPLTETSAVVVTLMSTVLPAFLVYKIANWIWRHIPDLGGFGPGAG